jgi:hypothetical protein
MTASEFAFLALGLVLGVASGSAIVVVLGSRPPARVVRLTVGHDAVPRRAATLSSDAFTAHNEPARGGPADRRRLDRDAPANDPPAPSPYAGLGPPGRPVMGGTRTFSAIADRPVGGLRIRTTVPSWPTPTSPATAPLRPPGRDRPVMVDVPVEPERNPSIDALRIQAVLAAEEAQARGRLNATALLETRPTAEGAEGAAQPPPAGGTEDAGTADATPAVIRILRGDHRVLLRTVAVLAGADDAMRRPWQAAVVGLAEAVIERAIERGVLAFPVGNPFWDTFTTSQCRAIAGALAATGFRFDGIDGWADERIPSYRDLTAAVAVAGIEPRRIRAWPTQEQIGALHREVTVAADEFLARQSPDLDLAAVRELAGARVAELELLWRHWDLARPVLAGPAAPPTVSPAG